MTVANVNSLRFNTGGTAFTDALSSPLTLGSGGLLVTPVVGGGRGHDQRHRHQRDDNVRQWHRLDRFTRRRVAKPGLYINAPIVNNGATPIGLTKSGPGTLFLTGGKFLHRPDDNQSGDHQCGLRWVLRDPGGTNGTLGASSNAPANLVLNGGTLQYIGPTASTDRGLTISYNNGTLEARARAPSLSAVTSPVARRIGIAALVADRF